MWRNQVQASVFLLSEKKTYKRANIQGEKSTLTVPSLIDRLSFFCVVIMARKKSVQTRRSVSSESSDDESSTVKRVKVESDVIKNRQVTTTKAHGNVMEEESSSSEEYDEESSEESQEGSEEESSEEEEDESQDSEERDGHEVEEGSASCSHGATAFMRTDLRKAGFNIVVKDSTERNEENAEVESIKDCKVLMQTLTCGSLKYEDAPKTYEREMSYNLPRYSHLYSIEPAIPEDSMASVVNQIRKKLLRVFPVENVPMVYIYTRNGTGSMSKAILIQCLDAQSHRSIKLEFKPFELALNAGADTKIVAYKLKKIHSGLRVDPRVCTVTFKAIFQPSEPLFPIDHDVAVRVALHFAKTFGCDAPQDLYPEQAHGLLQVCRDRLVEYNLEGNKVVSDLNGFQMSFWLPSADLRKKFKPYLTDETTGRLFQFEFPGEEVFCKTCKNNAVHNHSWCSKRSDAEWPAQYALCSL